MLSSTHVRLTRTSSDLRLLAATLCPPSPILTPNDLLAPSTFSEIPLIIDFVIDKFSTPLNSPLRFEYDADVCTPPKASRLEIDIATAQGRVAKLPRLPMTASPVTLSSNLASSYSVNESMLDEVFFTPKSFLSSQSLVSTPSPSPSPLSKSLFHLTHIRSLAISDSVGSSLSESPSVRTALGGANRQAWVFNSRMTSNSTMTVPVEDRENEQTVYLGTSATFSTLPTPSFAPPSPSPSVDVISPISLTYSRRHRRPLERSGAIHHLKTPRSIPRTSRLHLLPHEPQSPVIAPVRTTRWQLTDSPSASSMHSLSFACTTLSDSGVSSKHPYLPRDLTWLGGTDVELWIDQEGFRAIRPMMRLMGYSPRSRSLLPYGERGVSSDVSGGVAEFMPVKRESFAFHYATLDGPPMLRRVTVGGDESRDYLSRHAALNIKTNGVYTVLGSESMVLGSPQEHVKMQWKFDYLVDDRYTDGSGRVLPGEKIITPLTFSCSPFLLHPMQGKKVGFVHLVKKSVVPKLSAEKLEPPERPKNVGQLNQVQRMASLRRMRRHGPSRSDAHANPEGVLRLPSGALVGSSPLGPSKGGRILEGTRQMQYTRRRRASSAGEHGYVISSLHELMSAQPVPIAEDATAELPKMTTPRNENPPRARLNTTLGSTHNHGYLKGRQDDKWLV
ncbi:hypothetical protein DEU56DRAFT_976126 [Suillus clintonianus]|uniref:uncharacterized protein n=1 Tax=Suillus clintonianus TaxID=1904413 RepID=UPI001B86D7B9|nr:uncharacterized protein DEU56DRAFT_976126 [Suillus clintonianus]KAG2155541.1 hypothetical protein DEU56DRAFT_976126 [Suillus clintonianus]